MTAEQFKAIINDALIAKGYPSIATSQGATKVIVDVLADKVAEQDARIADLEQQLAK